MVLFLDSTLTSCCHIKWIVISSNFMSYVEFWITLVIPKGTIIIQQIVTYLKKTLMLELTKLF